jgi:hypothetical protein
MVIDTQGMPVAFQPADVWLGVSTHEMGLRLWDVTHRLIRDLHRGISH